MTRSYKSRDYFNIQCRDCGELVKTNSYATSMCKPCSSYSEFRRNMSDYKWRLKKLLGAAKFRSKDKKLSFDITHEHLIELWENNNGKCVVTGRSFDLTSSGVKGQVNPNAPSIDKIIPANGYVIGNVRLITYHANISISEFGLDMLKELAKDILNLGK